jgi:tRNA(Ile)-lysidine synthase
VGANDAVSAVDERVAAWAARHGLPRPGERVVVGCSGGADSTALLLALAALARGPLVAVYVDHGLRAGTAAEAAQVAALAASVHARFEAIAVEVAARGNLLAAARRARYAALARAARAAGARCVAVGHTATDQAETVAFRAARGDVAHALAGIPPVRPLDGDLLVVRPLLEVRRDETFAYAHAHGVAPVADPTNERDRFTRTRIRRALARSDGAEQALARLAHAAAERVAALDEAARALGPLEALDAASVHASGGEVALRLLRRAGLHRAGRRHAQALLDLTASTAGTHRLDLGGGIEAERRYGRLRLGARPSTHEALPEEERARVLPVAGPGRYALCGQRVEVRVAPPAALELPPDAFAPLDGALLDEGLVLRAPRAGDRLRGPAGVRKLHDMLIDHKVPRPLRALVPVLAVDGTHELLWAPGLGTAFDRRASARSPQAMALAIVASPTDRGGAPARGGG